MTDLDSTLVTAWMATAAGDLAAACPRLTELDAARGDADHGVNMERGFGAIAQELAERPPASAGEALLAAAKVLRGAMGGTSGPLWSAALRSAGKTLGTAEPATAGALGDALHAAAAAVAQLGGAQEGDNTMLDALLPAARELERRLARGDSLAAAAAAASEAADAGAEATSLRVASKGRASYLGERGVGHADPGAASAAVVIGALSRALAAHAATDVR